MRNAGLTGVQGPTLEVQRFALVAAIVHAYLRTPVHRSFIVRNAKCGLDGFSSRLAVDPVRVGRYPMHYRSQNSFNVTELTRADLAQLPDGVRLPRGDDAVVRGGLLEHPPHGLRSSAPAGARRRLGSSSASLDLSAFS